ncbi:MAG TPA: ABC transporter substrate-binding protein [Syntrophorhabdales bacterium]|nr:ABC transporter substrate-binding protein [Syntrophorhabdales bacterium]
MKKNVLIGGVAICALFALLLGPAWAQEKPIKLGVMFVSSGPMGGYGKHGFQAVQLAVDEINAVGGILGRKMMALTADSKMQPPVGVEIAKKYILDDKVDFMIGPTSSGVAAALSPVITEHKMILVLTQAAADSLTGAQFNPYMFSTLSNAMMHSRAGAYFVADKPYKRWMCIGPNYNYGWDSWASFKSKLKELRPDAEFVGELWPKLTEPDYREFVKKIIDAKPDAVWSPLWGMDAVNFIKQALPTKLFDNVKFAFPDGAALETLAPLGKDMPDGIYIAARYFFLTPDSDMNRKFVKSYHDRFKEWPDYMAEETYAGVYFIKAAVERAGTTDTQKVIQAVEREPLAWETPEGWKIIRAQDHSVVEDVVWGETKYSDKYGFATMKNMQAIQAEQICRTPEELKEVRAAYEKRLKEGK